MILVGGKHSKECFSLFSDINKIRGDVCEEEIYGDIIGCYMSYIHRLFSEYEICKT
jgi:hypothetical protein